MARLIPHQEIVQHPRFLEWEDLSHRLSEYHYMFVVDLQTLAYVDSKLELLESDPNKNIDVNIYYEKEIGDENFSQNKEKIILSRLWVLGAYELVRSVHEEARKKAHSKIDDWILENIKLLKKEFSKIRMPLAKYQPAGGKKSLQLAPVSQNHTNGIAWDLENGKIIVRKHLSDGLMDFLRGIPQ